MKRHEEAAVRCFAAGKHVLLEKPMATTLDACERILAAWRRAVTLEATLQYDEPPAWFYAVRQSLGAAQLRAGAHAEAEQVFREALATHPRDGRLLYGLWQALLAQGRGSEAVLVEQQFKRAWADATSPLTLEDL